MGTKTEIRIEPQGVFFNKHQVKIGGGANNQYQFITEAKRELTLNYAGTTPNHLPIWEFQVYNPHDNFIVMNAKIVGYGLFFHQGTKVVQVHGSEQKVVHDGFVGEPQYRELGKKVA